MNEIELGRKIKEKYPQYKDMTDSEVGKKVMAKYPQYRPEYTTGQKVKEFAKGVVKSVPGTLQGASDIGQKVFGGIARKIVGGPEQKRIALPETMTTAANDYQRYGKTTGDVAQFFIPGIGAAKVAQAPKAASFIGRIGQGVAKEAPSAVRASGLASSQEGNTDNIVRNAILFGTISKGVSALGSGVSKLTKSAPGRLVDTAIKPTLDESRKAIKYGGKTLGQELVDRGIVGTDKSILNKATEKINKAEDELQKVLKGSKETITREEVGKYMQTLFKSKNQTPGMGAEVEKIREVLNEFPAVVKLSKANEKKRNIYNALRDVAFRIDPNLSTKKEAMKAMAKAIKELIEKKTGGDTVKKLNQELSVFGRTQDRIIDKLARAERNNLVGLSDIGAGTIGAISAGAPGAAAVVAGKIAAGSTLAKTGTAQVLKKLSSAIEKIPERAGNITKASLFKAIQSIIDQEK